jgi:hypothetical protein
MSIYCSSCGAVHDLDLAPDTGECVCGGSLIEGAAERGLVGPEAMAARVITAVNDGLAGLAIIRGKAPRGVN